MNFKRFMIIFGGVCLAAVLVFVWGCQNQPTGPELSNPVDGGRLRGYSSGSCGSYWYTHWTAGGSANFSCNGSNGFSLSFSGASFVTGIGWSSGGSRSISFSGSCSGCNWGPGVYGWQRNPLIEYYIGRSGGSSAGSYSCDGSSYNLNITRRYGQPSIDGTSDFDQYNCNGPRTGTKDMGCHFNGWRNLGKGGSSQDYMVVMVESWSGGSGSANVTIGGGGGGSTTTTTSGGGGSTTTTSGGGGGGGGSIPITVRGRSTDGQGKIDVRVGGNTITTWTLGTGMANWETSTQYSGGLNVCFTNDADNRDIQIDYVVVNGQTRQSENQSYNTGVWQDGSCGGSNSEWLHCNGCIGYGDVNGGGGGGGGGSTSTTTSGSSWWGGWGGGGSWW
jgi:endo-1,4-beta-xylanase